jgi:hypothetical protein
MSILLKFLFALKPLEVSADSQPYPYFTQNTSEKLQTLQCRPRAPAGGGPAKFRRTGGRDRPGAGGGGPEGSGGSISVGVRSGRGAGEVAQWRRPVLAAVPPCSGEVEPRQRLRAGVELRWGLEEAPGW